MTRHVDFLPVAQQAMDEARDYLCSHPPGSVSFKGDRDMASDVDLAIEHHIRGSLARATPNIGFMGEEEGSFGDTTGLVWALDPVDGTVNLLHNHPLVAISLALLDNNRPVLGVIDMPAFGCRYWAVQDHGAHRDGIPIAVGRTTRLSDALVAMGDYAVGHDANDRNASRVALTGRLASRVQRIRMHGSAAVDLAWLASGIVDAAVILANNPWDVAAGTVIARESGALVLDIDGSQHDNASSATIGVVPSLKDQLLDILHD
jgi:myo-inositol-1(or 4)-monophosphatase